MTSSSSSGNHQHEHAPRHEGTIPDLRATRTDVERYMVDRRRPAQSLVRERNSWAIFKRWCVLAGVSPALPVAPQILISYMVDISTGKALPRGKVPSVEYFRNLVAAVILAHRDAGFPSPVADPTVRAVRVAIGKRLKARPARRAAALTPSMMKKISSITVPPSFKAARRAAMALLALETGVAVEHLMWVERQSIRGRSPSLTIELPTSRHRAESGPGQTFTLTCPDGRGCRSSCATCAMRALDALLPADGKYLFGFKSPTTAQNVAAGDHERSGLNRIELPDRSEARVHAQTLIRSTRQLLAKAAVPATVTPAGWAAWNTPDPLARRAACGRIALVADERRLALVRDRAMLLIAFHTGLRCIEVLGMRRDQIRRTARGFNFHVGVRKAHQDGASDGLAIRPAADSLLCPVRAMEEWLDVRDAVTGAGNDGLVGYLFCPVHNGVVSTDRALNYHAFRARLRNLSLWAGLAQRLTGHSARRGYAQTADDSGAAHSRIMATMDLVTYEVFQTYLAHEGDNDGPDVSALFGRAS